MMLLRTTFFDHFHSKNCILIPQTPLILHKAQLIRLMPLSQRSHQPFHCTTDPPNTTDPINSTEPTITSKCGMTSHNSTVGALVLPYFTKSVFQYFCASRLQ